MTHGDTYTCGDQDLLIAYLYDECRGPERAAVAAHLSRCPRCSDELASLASARRLLAAWTPPEVSLGFRLPDGAAGAGAPSTAPGSRPSWWRQPLPAWAQVAAAVAIFAAGLGAGMASTPDAANAELMQRELSAAAAAVEALESRIRGIEQIAQTTATGRDAASAARAPSTPQVDVMPRVNAQIATSERRIRSDLATRQELALGLVQLKQEEALMRQQMREEFQTGLNEVSRVFLSWRNGE
jgi:anti-sigma factor RsiW